MILACSFFSCDIFGFVNKVILVSLNELPSASFSTFREKVLKIDINSFLDVW